MNCAFATDSTTGEVFVSGTIRFVEAEGGCWQLRGDDGRRFELRASQAPRSILRDGAQATLVLAPRNDLVSICQMGTIADVERVERFQAP